MKYRKQKIEECIEWVKVNGLYPQRGGAPIARFCQAMGITWDSYDAWMKKPDFSDAIKKANQVFAQETQDAVVNALKKKALGYEYTETSEEGGPRMVPLKEQDGSLVINPRTGKPVMTESDEIITKKLHRRQVVVGPDTGAAIFMLTNLDPEHWKNRQATTLDGGLDINAPIINFKSTGEDETEG